MDVRSRIADLREKQNQAYQAYRDRSRLVRVFRHRDFRLLWTGALVSFIGSWVQRLAEGWLVYQITGKASLLGLVVFCASVPTSILGPIAGTLADTFNRRTLLVVTQAIFAAGAFYLAAATHYHFVTYEQIIVVALILGIVSTVEQPARQSTVSACVPAEDLPLAIPINAMTFNLSRLIGPAIGGLLLVAVGPAACYFVNGVSFFALIFSALAIRSDLSPRQREAQPIKDLLVEGALYTYRDRRLRTLFILESIVAIFGLTYITQMPTIVDRMLHRAGDPRLGTHDKFILSTGYIVIGVGAIIALSIIMQFAERRVRGLMIRIAMTCLAVALIVLGFVRSEYAAYPIFGALGMCAITHFNITNTLFQTIAPPRLRGRVLAMHIWALNGLGPFGVLMFGYIADAFGMPLALQGGGAVVLLGALWSWVNGKSLQGVDDADVVYGVPD
ncbi:MAG TPA: MFS transporter [Fimbriimonadaceae bacterium]|nr:MFS transporter [Fimbriimonadaceae bacterium]